MSFDLPLQFTPLHVLLAYAGLFIHTLGKLAKAQRSMPDYTFKKFVKNHAISFMSSIILIPVVLLMACDMANAETLPINNTTSVFAGYGTNSVFRMFMGITKKRVKDQPADYMDDDE